MKTKLLLFVCFIIAIIAFSGCKKTSSPPSAPTSSAAPVAQPQENHAIGGTTNTTLAEIKYFQGSIGNSLDLQMKLFRTGDQLTGSYSYLKVGTRIDLRGTVDKDGSLTLQEFDTSGKQTGLFKGLWKPDPDGLVTIVGNWSKPEGDKAADKKTAFSIHEEPIYFTGEVDLQAKSIKESNKKLVYEISAQYPQINNFANPNFEKFNQVVRGSVTKKVAEFKKEMTPKPDEDPRPENSMRSDLGISYSMALAQDDVISLTLNVSDYYQGAAHPNSYTEAINYDLKNGKVLKLADLFKPGTKYLQTISNYCIADLKKQSNSKGADGMLDDSSINTGAGPSPKNYGNWTITRKGLGVNFNPYQVGPYAAGPQYVVVPYSTLKDLINPDSVIGQFAK